MVNGPDTNSDREPMPAGRISAVREGLWLFEDDHLLVVNKPAGLNTHSPAPFAGEGFYDWLRHREARWSSLAIIHRLDKETSGVLVFAKTSLANRSLTRQFTEHTVRKRYLMLTDRLVKPDTCQAVSSIVRAGERYLSRPARAAGEMAETHFRVIAREPGRTLVEAVPVTGRTHQIRVHASEQGWPILGDTLYGGTSWPRLCLQADSLQLRHPVTGEWMTFRAPADFSEDARQALRMAVIDPAQTNAFRLIHGAGDGWPGWQVDRLGDFLLSQTESELSDAQRRHLETLPGVTGAYHKRLQRRMGGADPAGVSARLVLGRAAPERFVISENGAKFELSFNEGSSVGLFLDQRDNRRRFLVNHVAADFPVFARGGEPPRGEAPPGRVAEPAPGRPEMLNTFAYTCGFSVCAAKAGARTTSLDLSKKYLEWGKRNFTLNGLDPAAHEFIYGDAFDWQRRLAKKQRRFDAIVLDPPTFSQSKEQGVFRAEKDYAGLVAAALPLLKAGGVLFASTNAAGLKPEDFLKTIERSITQARRQIRRRHYAPQPPDFPITRSQPGHLKTVWLQID